MPATFTSHAALDARLRALARALGSTEPEQLEQRWSSLKSYAHIRELFREAPEAVKAIVDFARMKAKGEIKGDAELGYAEMTGKAIAAAMARRAV